MTILAERLMKMCFEDESIHRVVWSLLMNDTESGNSLTVKPLESITLRSIIQQKIGNDLYKNVILKLVYKEPLLIQYFDPSFADGNDYDHLTGDPREVFGELRKDPQVVLAAVEQNGWSEDVRPGHRNFVLIVGRHSLIVRVNDKYVGEISNRENIEFDTIWVEKFMRIMLKMRFRWVDLRMDGEGVLDHNYMRAHLNEHIGLWSKVVPPEGWKAAIEGRQRMVWYKGNHSTWSDGVFHAQYSRPFEFQPFYNYRCFYQ